MKKNTFISLLAACFLTVQLGVQAQIKDSILIHKKNIVYVVPSALMGDTYWDFNNYWLEVGYLRRLPEKSNSFIDVKLGFIFSSGHSTGFGTGLFTDIPDLSATAKGFNLNLEHKISIAKHAYYSTNLFYQRTSTTRVGEYDRFRLVSDNTYSVVRSVYCVYPKIGFLFINQKTNLYTDIGFGAGIRYVSSHAINKINTTIHSGTEAFVNKEFDKGGKFAQKVYIQLKIGYNF